MPNSQSAQLELTADVLVIGGGLAGTWAAAAAAATGASVILADKGYCGTSGVTATAGPGHWWVAPEARAAAIAKRQATSGGLSDPAWMARILDMTWRSLPTLSDVYDFPTDEAGVVRYGALRGAEYMRAMRLRIEGLGVAILDHSPALELLVHADGSVAGARGVRRQVGQDWTVRAGAVVLATGGCAFKSGLLGGHTNTGDGLLMAAETGAELSGMELSNYYTIAAAGSTVTRSMSYIFGRYFDASGRELSIPSGSGMTQALAAHLLTGPVYCSLDRTPADIRERMPQVQPNFMLPFDRWGVDPYKDRFEVTLHAEGTVRGVGGLRIADEECQTSTPGLFAAGDVASRELVAGAISGGGAINSSWALSSGQWAGAGALHWAQHAKRDRSSPVEAVGEAGVRGQAASPPLDTGRHLEAVQAEVLPYDKTIFRTGTALTGSQDRLDQLWNALEAAGPAASGRDRLRLRETAAMTAAARWCTRAALDRTESRGMHSRLDATGSDPRLARRLTIGGLGQIWTRWDDPPSIARAAS